MHDPQERARLLVQKNVERIEMLIQRQIADGRGIPLMTIWDLSHNVSALLAVTVPVATLKEVSDIIQSVTDGGNNLDYIPYAMSVTSGPKIAALLDRIGAICQQELPFPTNRPEYASTHARVLVFTGDEEERLVIGEYSVAIPE